MPRKRRKPEEIVAKRRRVDVVTAQGTSRAEAIRSIGVSEATCRRWRNGFGGLKLDQVKRLKEPELENGRLRKAVSDLTLDKPIVAEALRGDGRAPRVAGRRSGMSARFSASRSAGPAARSAGRDRRGAASRERPRTKSG